MNVVMKLSIVCGAIVVLWLNNRSDASEPFNEIDTFSSASPYHSLKVKPSKAYSTYATIQWEEYWKDTSLIRAYNLRWGSDSGKYTDSLNLRPYQNKIVNTSTINGLAPNMVYHAQFYRDYNGFKWNREFKFATPPHPTVPPVGIRFSQRTPQQLAINRVGNVAIYSVSGKLLTSSSEFSDNVSLRASKEHLPAGTYISCFKDAENRVLASEVFTVSR